MKAFVLFCAINLVAISSQAAKSAGGSPGDIAVRFSISAGYQYSSLYYEADRKNDAASTFAFGGDFNVPLPPIKTLIGITGWISLPSSVGENASGSLMLLGAYVGYLGDNNDFFIGPAAGVMSTRLSDAAASPNHSVVVQTTSTCGFGGWRHYFSKGVTTGFGINAFYCSSGNYDRSTKATTDATEVKTRIESSASAAGGYVYLLIGWNDTRSLF